MKAREIMFCSCVLLRTVPVSGYQNFLVDGALSPQHATFAKATLRSVEQPDCSPLGPWAAPAFPWASHMSQVYGQARPRSLCWNLSAEAVRVGDLLFLMPGAHAVLTCCFCVGVYMCTGQKKSCAHTERLT